MYPLRNGLLIMCWKASNTGSASGKGTVAIFLIGPCAGAARMRSLLLAKRPFTARGVTRLPFGPAFKQLQQMSSTKNSSLPEAAAAIEFLSLLENLKVGLFNL
jgi:hypothetical protein